MGRDATTRNKTRYPKPEKDPVLERQPGGSILLLFESHRQAGRGWKPILNLSCRHTQNQLSRSQKKYRICASTAEKLSCSLRQKRVLRFWCTLLTRQRRGQPGSALAAGDERFASVVFEIMLMRILKWISLMLLLRGSPIRWVLLSLLLGGNLWATGWQEVSRNSNLAIYIRHRVDSPIEEVRGVGEFNASILVVRGILANVSKYSEFMPYTKESRVLPQDAQLCTWC